MPCSSLLSNNSSRLALVVLITKMNFTITTATNLIDRLTLQTLQFMDSVVDLDFLSILWVCYIDSAHAWRFSICYLIIINFFESLTTFISPECYPLFCGFAWNSSYTFYLSIQNVPKSETKSKGCF